MMLFWSRIFVKEVIFTRLGQRAISFLSLFHKYDRRFVGHFDLSRNFRLPMTNYSDLGSHFRFSGRKCLANLVAHGEPRPDLASPTFMIIVELKFGVSQPTPPNLARQSTSP